MKLDEVVAGPVYLDTNVLYMYLRADPVYLPALSVFFHRIVRGEIDAHIGVPVIDELFYRLLLAHLRNAAGGNPLDTLRQDLPGAIEAHGRRIADSIRQLMSLPNMISSSRFQAKRDSSLVDRQSEGVRLTRSE